MRHRRGGKKLGRSSAHLKATLASLVVALIERKRIRTTLTKARQARRLAERMMTLAKRGTLAARRRALARLGRESAVVALWAMAPASAQRAGGYTRVIKLGSRPGDGSETAMVEWVDATPPPAAKKKREKKEKAESAA
ncbi:MAG: 50S ribosomal protein L17 [Lentisphaerae bacterium]|nr:50S ribosomal protein L17 [Lentisphaerota bacterium]